MTDAVSDSSDDDSEDASVNEDSSGLGPSDDPLAEGSAPSIDGARFRATLGHFATGITVITATDGTGPVGFTCQSFVSLSLEPPLVAFCPGRQSSTWPRIRAAGTFAANILNDDQEATCRVFATSGADKFQGVGWRPGSTGSPILDGCLAWVEGRLVNEHEAGDHVIAVGEVLELGVAEGGRPLLFYRGGYARLDI